MRKRARISKNEFYYWILKKNKEQIISNRFLIQELFLLNSQFLKILQVKKFFERKKILPKKVFNQRKIVDQKNFLPFPSKNYCQTSIKILALPKNHSWPPQVFFRFWKRQYCKKKHSFCWKRKFATNLKAFVKIIMTKLSNCQKLSK